MEYQRESYNTSRYRVPWLSLTAYLHALEQAKRLRDAGIVCNVAFEKGLVTCTYYSTGPHLHLGLYIDGTAVDPRVVLE